MAVFGFDNQGDPMVQLPALNLEVSALEQQGEPLQATGLPEWHIKIENIVSDD